MLSAVVSRIRCLAAFAAQEIWGVIRQFFAVSSGFSLHRRTMGELASGPTGLLGRKGLMNCCMEVF